MYSVSLGGVLFPVAPEKITTKIKNANKTLTLINEGEINFIKQAGLTEFEFDVLLPAVEYSFAIYKSNFTPPSYFLGMLEQIKTRKSPVQFSISRISTARKSRFDTNITVSLESYTVKEDAKEGTDLIVSIKLKQYRKFETKIVKVIEETNTAVEEPVREESDNSPSPEPEKQTTYTVKKGDTLSIIARKFYGDGSKWPVIYNANKDKIINPNLIHPDQVLVIPPM